MYIELSFHVPSCSFDAINRSCHSSSKSFLPIFSFNIFASVQQQKRFYGQKIWENKTNMHNTLHVSKKPYLQHHMNGASLTCHFDNSSEQGPQALQKSNTENASKSLQWRNWTRHSGMSLTVNPWQKCSSL